MYGAEAHCWAELKDSEPAQPARDEREFKKLRSN